MASHDTAPGAAAPLYEGVARELGRLIEDARLGPGDRLPPERELAQRLGVSRTSVRQALTLLRTMGVVEPRRGDGIYLLRSFGELRPELTFKLLAEQRRLPAVMEVREALETHIARLAARRRSSADLVALRRALAEMAAAIRAGENAAAADARFHASIVAAADNPLLADLMGQLAEPIAQTRTASLSRPGRPPRSLEGHRRILEAIEARNEEGAASAMREHLLVVADVAHVAAERERPAAPA